MNNQYLQELIAEASERGGGFLLSMEDKPAAVVLTVEKYNQLISGSVNQLISQSAGSATELASQQYLNRMNQFLSKKVLVTGGAGYIGAHLVRELVKSNYDVTVVDNLSCGRKENIDPKVRLIEGDFSDENLLRDIFGTGDFEAVFHMAASIEVEESVREPQKYLENNALNTARLLKAMNECGVKKIIFSSTAAVYGEQKVMPISEDAELKPNNPYGYSKYLAEKIIEYYCKYSGFRATIFRYFNACGFGYEGGIAGTHFTHLIPIVMDVAKGSRPAMQIFGDDYETPDGTCVRDYVHVLDIVKPHIIGLEKIEEGDGYKVINIGTGRGSTVKEVISAASETLNRIIPMQIAPRRQGDAPCTVANNTRLKNILNYDLQHSDMQTIIKTSWQQMEE